MPISQSCGKRNEDHSGYFLLNRDDEMFLWIFSQSFFSYSYLNPMKPLSVLSDSLLNLGFWFQFPTHILNSCAVFSKLNQLVAPAPATVVVLMSSTSVG